MNFSTSETAITGRFLQTGEPELSAWNPGTAALLRDKESAPKQGEEAKGLVLPAGGTFAWHYHNDKRKCLFG